jgi:hypothetical protein
MAKEQMEPPAHMRWRKIGESVTSHYMNTQRKDVFIDPCECIKKLFDAAKAAVDKVPKQDAVFVGSQRAAAMRTVRGVNRFQAHVKAYEYAKTAEAIYRDTVPGKWRVASEAQVKECGLESEGDLVLLKFDKNGRPIKTPFKAHIAIPANQLFCESMPATLVFKGTTVLEDWLNNAQQGMDMDSDYYKKAVELGAMIKNARRPVSISGHSLGGGLAAACAYTCGKDAWTFNAAGLHPNTVERYGEVPVPANIQAYRHEGEVLTAVQEPGWVGKFARIALPIVTLGPLLGNLVSTKLREMPSAPGTKHDLPCIQDDWDSVERHGMSNTLMSFNKMLREAEDELRQQTGVQCKQPVIV